MTLANNTIERLFVYRRILHNRVEEGRSFIFSHELAQVAGATSEQVRRDLMMIGAEGNRRTGYDCSAVLQRLDARFQSRTNISVVLVGVGNLGRAVLAYFSGKPANIRIEAAFESDPGKLDRVIHGVRCHPVTTMESVLAERVVDLGVITVPAPAAQDVAERLVRSGVRAILNLAPIRLRVPAGVHVEDLDLTLSIEKLAFLAKAIEE